MKFYNKKKIERSSWSKVVISSMDYEKERFLWCKRQSSNGRFYRYYMSFTWYFENEEDATLFALRWS